jgi:sirohydrochlorin cobaltochelatase
VEGFPSLAEILDDLRLHDLRRVVLKPFLIVAGDHARNDLAGPEKDSWQSVLTREGLNVIPVIRGLGEQPAVARIFVKHIAEAAAEAGMDLR